MKYLLDTSIISELISQKPNPSVVEFVDSLDQEDMYLSVITIGEITRAIQKIYEPRRKSLVETWVQDQLFPRFDGHILSLDAKIMKLWGEVYARLEGMDINMPAVDSMLVATALAHRLVLVTINDDDFSGAGIEVVNPW
ncbi:MAG: type II toxin-antitoxin system VapC family toxin [Anaerolineales bacterium]|nr:type II toxin-antitoxin system VapC family toxin [Anaerolineales bacterium]MCB9145116.1 type II toxin-antitoxin system VapC family toxin [Anaerolineales bacterium]